MFRASSHTQTQPRQTGNVINQKKKEREKKKINKNPLGAVQPVWSSITNGMHQQIWKNTFAKKGKSNTETLSHCKLTSGFLTPGVQLVTAWNKSTRWPLVALPYTRQIFWASLGVCWQLRRWDSEGKTKRSYIILWLCQPWPQRTTINLITTSMWPTRTELRRTIIMACAACFPATASAAWC